MPQTSLVYNLFVCFLDSLVFEGFVNLLDLIQKRLFNVKISLLLTKKVKHEPPVHRGFLTPDSFHSSSLVTWGSSWASKEAKFIKEFDFLGFSRCFSARIEKSSKTSKIQPNCVILGGFLKFSQF